MTRPILPRYPIYIPSKERYAKCLTAQMLDAAGVPFYLVVEPQECEAYISRFGPERVLALPFSNLGSVIPARNWIKEHATAAGHLRHWQLDDNIRDVYRLWRGVRVRCSAGVALAIVEDFTDRYENIAIAGLNYKTFVVPSEQPAPFYLNCHVYSCCLILNSIPNGWRGRYNEDTDICLQILADSWCTVLINVFSIDKMRTMTMGGGNTSTLYQGDGRLRMARALERLWPGVVETKRRFNHPQHVVKDAWRRFDTPLKLRQSVDLTKAPKIDEYGMELVQTTPQIRSERLRAIVSGRVSRRGPGTTS